MVAGRGYSLTSKYSTVYMERQTDGGQVTDMQKGEVERDSQTGEGKTGGGETGGGQIVTGWTGGGQTGAQVVALI